MFPVMIGNYFWFLFLDKKENLFDKRKILLKMHACIHTYQYLSIYRYIHIYEAK